MSLAVGALCAEEAGREVWAINPVRTMGGDKRTDMAFCASSFGVLAVFGAAVSRTPPIELAMLAVDP